MEAPAPQARAGCERAAGERAGGLGACACRCRTCLRGRLLSRHSAGGLHLQPNPIATQLAGPGGTRPQGLTRVLKDPPYLMLLTCMHWLQ